MAPSIVSEEAHRARRLVLSLDLEQLCRLYNAFFPGPVAVDPFRVGRPEDIQMQARVREYIVAYRVTDERIAEILGYDRIEYAQQPDDLPRGPRVPMPVIPPATPGGVTVGPIPGRRPDPSTLRPTLELTNALWAALGRLLNPANLQEEFASAILRGDMELARVLFDRLQDEGLTY